MKSRWDNKNTIQHLGGCVKPVIDFQHVLNELSVNRNDPCEVIRELISNAYDAGAKTIKLAAIQTLKGICFFDDGSGLSRTKEFNGITPYSAFFSIGKSTKRKGDGGIGYKCQGSKLCFAANRVLVITKTDEDKTWFYKIVENPRRTLSVEYEIDPAETINPHEILNDFFITPDEQTHKILASFDKLFFEHHNSGTLIVINGFDIDAFPKHFVPNDSPEESYLYNYIKHYTKHGDTTFITNDQGFAPSEVLQVSGKKKNKLDFQLWNGSEYINVPFGFPYLPSDTSKDIKDPLDVARLRDGRFYSRAAKRITYSGKTYAFILAVDGNRRAHDGYASLDRKGASKSGIRLSDQRGVWVSSNGIKITRYNEILLRPELEDYSILFDAESSSHYHFIIDGDFELVTNRNAISKNGTSSIEDSTFISEIKKFLDAFEKNNIVFRNLLTRLRREQSGAKLNQQITNLDRAKEAMKERERFEINKIKYVSPLPGEEYLVGVLYAELSSQTGKTSPFSNYWKKVLTFSTLGIDSLATDDGSLKAESLIAIEYKYIFSNTGPFNHALCIVDYIIAWELELEDGTQIRDDYGCYGDIIKVAPGYFEIQNINHVDGDSYGDRVVHVASLKTLILDTFSTKYSKPPKK
jgi:hypothetical protein